jgi:phage baseplate assembly protein W
MAIYQDLDLNFGIHPIKKDVVTTQDANAIVRSVYNLLLTNHYERPFRPELGSNIRQMLFENITPSTAQTIRRFIEETIRNFEPRVTVNRIDVIPNDDQNAYEVRLEFFIDIQPTPFTATFLLERIR